MKTDEPSFLTLVRNPDLDQETAFTICRMISSVAWDFVEDWDWNWLEKAQGDYRSLINRGWLNEAWKRLSEKDWYSEQTTNDVDKKISTIGPLKDMTRLRTLVLQNNLVGDLQPISGMKELRDLNIYSNKVCNISVLKELPALEELSLASNPIESFRVIEELPNLRKLSISTDQVAKFAECKQLPTLRVLRICGDDPIDDFIRFPQMPSLKVLEVHGFKDLSGIERFGSLEALEVWGGTFSSLSQLSAMRTLTHLCLATSNVLDVKPLQRLHVLRRLSLGCPKVDGLHALNGLPVLHEVRIHNEASCDAKELSALRADLSPWDSEFKSDSKGVKPSLDLQVVDQATFDYYDSKAPYGIRPDEHNEGMLGSERKWLVEEIRESLSTRFEDDKDFHLPYTGGFQRTERVIIYSVEAYEALREVIANVQRILCETRNDWIIWCQSLLWESPEDQDIPEGMDDFIVWIYRDKITATDENAAIVRKLIAWRH